MIDIEKAIMDVIEFNKYIRYIEKNINKKSSDIIDGLLKQNNLSRRGLDERFNKICISKKGEQLSASVYIKRRQNQMKILQRSTIQEEEDRFDIDEIANTLKKLELSQKYGLIKVKINTKNYWNNYIDFNYKKILDFIFGDNTVVYTGNLEKYLLKDIVKYNKSFINTKDLDYLYSEDILRINNVDYISVDREWLFSLIIKYNSNSKNLDYYMKDYIYEDLNRYKTIFYKIKNKLGDESYKKSIEEMNDFKEFLFKKEAYIFNCISDIENGEFENIKLSNLVSDYLEKGIFKSNKDVIGTLVLLLLKGLIYIEEIKC